MRLKAFVHNNIHHASAAKHILHDATSQSPHLDACSDTIRKIGPLREQKEAVRCGAAKFMSPMLSGKITRHTHMQIDTALCDVGCRFRDVTFFTSFASNSTCKFTTAESCNRNPSNYKDSYVDTNGDFWDIQYGFMTDNQYAGVLAFKIVCTDPDWSCFLLLGVRSPMKQFCIKSKLSTQLFAFLAESTEYYAINMKKLVLGNLADLCLVKVEFAISLS